MKKSLLILKVYNVSLHIYRGYLVSQNFLSEGCDYFNTDSFINYDIYTFLISLNLRKVTM